MYAAHARSPSNTQQFFVRTINQPNNYVGADLSWQVEYNGLVPPFAVFATLRQPAPLVSSLFSFLLFFSPATD